MTVEEWVREALAAHIEGEYIHVTPDVDTAVGDFVTFFGAAITGELAKPEAERNLYAALSGSHAFTYEGQQYNATAAQMDYQETFDAWHAEGLI